MHILVMQSNRRLIKNVENLAATPSGQLGREFNSLGFPSLECRCRLSKLNISESDFAQDFQTIMDLRNIAKKFVRIINRHRKHIKNIFALIKHLERLAIKSFSFANIAFNIDSRQKMHLNRDKTITLAVFTTPASARASDIKTESAGLISADTRF